MSDSFITRAKKSLRHIIANPDVVAADDPLTAFSEALMNFHTHYCKDVHTVSIIPRYRYVLTPFYCNTHRKQRMALHITQSNPSNAKHSQMPFWICLRRCQSALKEYITPEGCVTTNSIEAFHGLALERGLIYTTPIIPVKTNMAICHKVF